MLDNEWDNCRLDVCKLFENVFCCQQLGMVLMVFELPIRPRQNAHISSWTDLYYPCKGSGWRLRLHIQLPLRRLPDEPFVPFSSSSLSIHSSNLPCIISTSIDLQYWCSFFDQIKSLSVQRVRWSPGTFGGMKRCTNMLDIFLKDSSGINLQYCSSCALNLYKSLFLNYKSRLSLYFMSRVYL